MLKQIFYLFFKFEVFNKKYSEIFGSKITMYKYLGVPAVLK